MGLVLSIYTKEAFEEHILPAINNADFSIVINKNRFNLKTDIPLEFEVLNEVWRIKTSKNYHIYKEKREIIRNTVLDGEQMFRITNSGGSQIVLLVRRCTDVFCAYEKYDISRISRLTIGEGDGNLIQYDYQHLISREHAEFLRNGSDMSIRCSGANGLYINSRYVTGTEQLHFGDYINIYSLHMVYLGNVLAIDTVNSNVRIDDRYLKPYQWEERNREGQEEEKHENSSKILFHRSPRIIEKIECDPIEIEEPPKSNKSQKKPVLMTIGPSFTMAIPMLLGALLMIASSRASGRSTGLFMYSGLVMAVSSACVGVIWGTVNMRYQKKTEAENETHRYEAYSGYLLKKADEIKQKYQHNQEALNKMYPEVNACLSYNEKSSMLWNRNRTHEDFLSIRLGLGSIAFQVPILIPKEKFRLDRDELAEKPDFIEKNYETLTKVPIMLNLLEHRLVGIVGGPEKKGAIQVAKNLVAQIATSNSYTDVKMIFVYDGDNSEDQGQWEFVRWLPHVWSEDKKIRYIASNKLEAGEIFYEITKILRQRAENKNYQTGQKDIVAKPHFVMFLSDPKLIEEEMIASYVFDAAEMCGLSTVMLTSNSELLPNACEYIVENDKTFQGIYNVSAQKEDRTKVIFDQVNDKKLDLFSRYISNLEVQETETGGEIPNTLTFFDMYEINKPEELHAEERWLKNRNYDNIRGLIGQKSGGAPCFMDVHEKYHGPHGLVAGTTGSGKSETLQTYMLSLAINYSPDDIGFFIIDYKGGGMANLFDGLPHMIGQISNLSGNQVHRAMVSIKSENRRRMRVFSEHGVNNINSYTKLYKNREAEIPVPHLFIIIDEFAELKREEPDFMKELISVAQVGRSLGVHLILATQKPAGTVDDNIWSNSKFRLCLRVQDRQESNDMLHKPDAAYITQAGRCYLQVGNDEVFELFQSGWSGAPYDESMEGGKTEVARLLTTNGKTEMNGGYSRALRKELVIKKWINELCDCLKSARGDDYIPARGISKELMNLVFIEIERRGLDYPRSKYNELRLKEFIEIYTLVESQEDISEAIIKYAKSHKKKLPEVKERTQLDAVKEYLADTARKYGYQQVSQLWMPVLSDHIYLEEMEDYRRDAFSDGEWKVPEGGWNLEVPIGMMDDPQNQSQFPLNFSFSEGGHHGIIGSVVSGKSTMIQTILYGLVTKYSPQYINIYALDFSSKMMMAFEGLAHFGGIMYEGEDDKIAKFFNMIEKMLEERKRAFRGGNYRQYVQVNGVTYPAIVIVIDNFSSFKEKTEDKYEKLLIQLSKEGVGHGIYLLLSAGGFGMNEIPSRIGENMKTVLCLEMPDKFAYSDVLHTTQISVIPESDIKGRGLALWGTRILEYQTALAFEAEDDYQRMEKIKEKCLLLNSHWNGKRAVPIPEIPENPTWEIFSELEDVQKCLGETSLLPVGYDSANAQVYSVDLSNTYCYLITGAARTGKKNYLKVLMEAGKLKKGIRYLIDGSGVMSQYASEEDLGYVGNEEKLFDFFMNDLTPVFRERNAHKRRILAEGGEESELYEITSKETPVFIYIADLMWFMNTIYAKENLVKKMNGFVETLTAKGRYHNIYFIGILNIEDKNQIRSFQAFTNFASYKDGIHFGGNISQNTFMNFEYLPFKEQAKTEKPGVGQLPITENEAPTRKIVVPLMGKRKKKK